MGNFFLDLCFVWQNCINCKPQWLAAVPSLCHVDVTVEVLCYLINSPYLGRTKKDLSFACHGFFVVLFEER